MPSIFGSYVRTDSPTYNNASIEFPFQVIAQTTKNKRQQLGVIANSHLLNSKDKNTYEVDNNDWGLLTDDAPPDDRGWFNVGDKGDKIWLEIIFKEKDQEIESIHIRHGPVSGGGGSSSGSGNGVWANYPDPILIHAAYSSHKTFQSQYRQIIAELTDPDEDPRPGLVINKGTADNPDNVQITQLLFTNLIMVAGHTTKEADEHNVPLLVVLPWSFPGTDTKGKADEINNLKFPKVLTPYFLGELQTGDIKYAFEILDASQAHEAKIEILDGKVFDSDGKGHVPAGMGAPENFSLTVTNNEVIYLKVDVVPYSGNFSGVSIGHGASVPKDTTHEKYYEIGHVTVNTKPATPIVTPVNHICGDFYLQVPFPPDHNTYVLGSEKGKVKWLATSTCH